MRGIIVAAGLALIAVEINARETAFVLSDDHASFQWRKDAGHKKPDIDEKAILWTRHEQVGIGNSLGGFSSVMLEALVEDRELVIHSVILEKFCEIVSCALRRLPDNPGYGPPKERFQDGTVTKADHFFYFVTGVPEHGILIGLRDYYDAAGCSGPGPTGPDSVEVPEKNTLRNRMASRAEELWPTKCMYTKLLHSLIRGPGVRFRSEVDWLHQHYVGSSDRFKQVMSMARNSSSETPNFIFDFVIHIRTLGLIEDLSTEEGFVEDAPAKAAVFMRSPQFESMLRCFAVKIADSIVAPGSHHTGHAPHHAPAIVGALHTTGIPVRKHRRHVLSAPETQGHGGREKKSRVRLEGGASGLLTQKRPRGAVPITVYLATDALDIREEFATRLKSMVESLFMHRGKAGAYDVEVDYFAKTLPPAMFFLWTYPMKEMKLEDWQGLVGTTAEWVFLGQGRDMLTVKGLKGGEKALLSSFAVSAAAFGRAASLQYLLGSDSQGHGHCTWETAAFFS